jgi:AAA15 family ATPase/GTPase
MNINKLKFGLKSRNLDWAIETIDFRKLNLLVGESGVGKTTILRSIGLICDVAKGQAAILGGVSWDIAFSHANKNYRWRLKGDFLDSKNLESDFKKNDKWEIIQESLIEVIGENCEEKIIFERDSEKLIFGSYGHLPRLKKDQSAISLFSEDDLIKPVVEAFDAISYKRFSEESLILSVQTEPSAFKINNLGDFNDFKQSVIKVPIVFKVLLMQYNFKGQFENLKNLFWDIFPNVDDLRVEAIRPENSKEYQVFFSIKEKGSDQWISQSWISSGMLRSLYLLSELFLIPKECVVLIDEFENSLGINCISDVTNLILDDENDTQFILTSHHPYIINNLPWETWQLVSRKGNTIYVNHSTDIPDLNTGSNLDKFTQLINYWEFQSAQQ